MHRGETQREGRGFGTSPRASKGPEPSPLAKRSHQTLTRAVKAAQARRRPSGLSACGSGERREGADNRQLERTREERQSLPGRRVGQSFCSTRRHVILQLGCVERRHERAVRRVEEQQLRLVGARHRDARAARGSRLRARGCGDNPPELRDATNRTPLHGGAHQLQRSQKGGATASGQSARQTRGTCSCPGS